MAEGKSNSGKTFGIISLIIAIGGCIFTLMVIVFGDNFYQQITGHSVFQPSTSEPIAETPDQAITLTSVSVAPSDSPDSPTAAPQASQIIVSPTAFEAFTVIDAEQVELGADCNYWVPEDKIIILADETASGATKTWDLTTLPAGFVIGEAVEVEIDGNVLGNSGVTFIIELADPQERRTLKMKDGQFFIVSPENAEGWLRLRQRYLACNGRPRTPIRFPASGGGEPLNVTDITNNTSHSFYLPSETTPPQSGDFHQICGDAYLETGSNSIEYSLNVPSDWVVIIDSWQAYWPLGSYQDDGILVVYGDWKGQTTVNTGALCGIPASWVERGLSDRRAANSNDGRSEYSIGP